MLAACPNVVSYTLSMCMNGSSNAIKLPPDVEIFPCFLGKPAQALLLWRGLQSLPTWEDTSWEMPMLNSFLQEQKG